MSQTKAQLIDGKGSAAFDGDLTVDTNTLYVDSTNNRVGLGTSSPRGLLDLGPGTGDGPLSSTPSEYQLILNADQSTTGDISRNIAFVNTTFDVSAAINSYDAGSGVSNGLVFATANTGTLTEKLRITHTGQVGIGTTSPSSVLHLKTASSPKLILDNSDSATAAIIDTWWTGTPLAFNIGTTERARIDGSGRLLVGTSTVPSASSFGSALAPDATGSALYNSRNTTSGTNHCLFYNPNGLVGRIQTSGTSTSYLTTSDYRLKENIVPVADGIARLQQLKPCQFNFTADLDTIVDGFIAHEVQIVVPEAISGEKDAIDDEGNPEYQGIDQSKLVPLLTAALQEAVAKIETLEAKVAALEAS